MIYKACGGRGVCPLAPSALSCHSGICWGGGIFLLPDDSATVVPCGGACPRRHLLFLPLWYPVGGLSSLPPAYPAFSLPFCPPSPKGKDRPPPPFPAGKGENITLFRRGLRPQHPCIKSFAALTVPAAMVPRGGLAPGGTGYPCHCGTLWRACPLCRPPTLPLVCLFAPIPPAPLPGGKGEIFLFSYARGFAPCIPGI